MAANDTSTPVSRPQRWDQPFGPEMTDADVACLLVRPEIAAIIAAIHRHRRQGGPRSVREGAGRARGASDSHQRREPTHPINGKECTPASDLADLSLFSGPACAVQHQCSPDSLRDGYNEIHIQQLPGEPQQKIVWVELRIVPR